MHNLAEFHLKLFGRPPKEDQVRLYESDCLGYDDGDRANGDRLVAVLGLSLAHTLQGRTLLLVPSALAREEVLEHVATMARLLVRVRKDCREGLAALRTAMKTLSIADGVLSMNEPRLWTAYGFHSDMRALPEWLSTRLLRD